MNVSTEKFSLYQTLDTIGALGVQHFTISDKHFLAVPNHYNGTNYRLNSVLYQWNGHQFVILQTLRTNGAVKFDFFRIVQDFFLAVSNYYNDTTHFVNSVIYKWKDNQFETFQGIGTAGAAASSSFMINNDSFIVFANHYNTEKRYSVHSTVYKWSGGHFVKLQSIQTYGAWYVKSFSNNGHTFLAFANHYDGSKYSIDSFIYKWDGSKFVLFQSIPTYGALSLYPFVMCGQTFLGVANYYGDNQGFNTQSAVYQAIGERFIKYRDISTSGTHGMTSFKFKGHTYLAVANYYSDTEKKYNINSTLFKWI